MSLWTSYGWLHDFPDFWYSTIWLNGGNRTSADRRVQLRVSCCQRIFEAAPSLSFVRWQKKSPLTVWHNRVGLCDDCNNSSNKSAKDKWNGTHLFIVHLCCAVSLLWIIRHRRVGERLVCQIFNFAAHLADMKRFLRIHIHKNTHTRGHTYGACLQCLPLSPSWSTRSVITRAGQSIYLHVSSAIKVRLAMS